MTSPYDVLGVKASASLAECKEAYRRMAKLHHPDCGGDAERFKILNVAWDQIKIGKAAKPKPKPKARVKKNEYWLEAFDRWAGFTEITTEDLQNGCKIHLKIHYDKEVGEEEILWKFWIFSKVKTTTVTKRVTENGTWIIEPNFVGLINLAGMSQKFLLDVRLKIQWPRNSTG